MPAALGLVGGAGVLPAVMAREARRAGWRVVAFALAEPDAVEEVADRVIPCRLGHVESVLSALSQEGIRHVVLAGRVWKDGLLRQGEAALDGTARALVAKSADWTDEELSRTATSTLTALGIELLDQRRFLAPWLAPAGHLAGPPLEAGTERDIERGLALARELAGRGVGQTVIVRAGVVAAVEALEGTDETIRRGLALAGPGAVIAKAAAPAQDYRFDVPAVGPATLARAVDGRAAALAVEAGRVLVIDRDAVLAQAGRAGISVVGVAGRPGSE